MSGTTELPVLVVGAGIAGLTAALELAEAGREVALVERAPIVGGRVARFHRYFPKLCPPGCGLEINARRLETHPRVRLLTETRVAAAERETSGWRVTLTTGPRWVNERCTGCGACTEACPATVRDRYAYGLGEVPAIRRPLAGAWPQRYVLDREACPEGCTACVEACPYGAIDLDAAPTAETLEVASVVLATGWEPYPLERLPELGGGVVPDVVSNVQLERLAAADGPTGGRIVRPSDGAEPRRVAFVQCAGSRDVNHLPYCSGVCCLASLKQALYVKERLPGAEVTIHYIDRRTPGRHEDFLLRVAATEGVRFVRGKVARVEAVDGVLRLTAEDTEAGRKLHEEADLVVLATGMVPSPGAEAFAPRRDEDGFLLDDPDRGLVVAGVARRPADVAAAVRDATGAAARAWALAARRA